MKSRLAENLESRPRDEIVEMANVDEVLMLIKLDQQCTGTGNKTHQVYVGRNARDNSLK